MAKAVVVGLDSCAPPNPHSPTHSKPGCGLTSPQLKLITFSKYIQGPKWEIFLVEHPPCYTLDPYLSCLSAFCTLTKLFCICTRLFQGNKSTNRYPEAPWNKSPVSEKVPFFPVRPLLMLLSPVLASLPLSSHKPQAFLTLTTWRHLDVSLKLPCTISTIGYLSLESIQLCFSPSVS